MNYSGTIMVICCNFTVATC